MVGRFNAVPITFAENDKQVLKYMWKCKGLRVAKTFLQTWKGGGFILLDFKIMWYWHKEKRIDILDKFESLEINPYSCDQSLIFTIFAKGAKAILWGNDRLFSRWS